MEKFHNLYPFSAHTLSDNSLVKYMQDTMIQLLWILHIPQQLSGTQLRQVYTKHCTQYGNIPRCPQSSTVPYQPHVNGNWRLDYMYSHLLRRNALPWQWLSGEFCKRNTPMIRPQNRVVLSTKKNNKNSYENDCADRI